MSTRRTETDPSLVVPLVQLTAIHFHYAGFASVTLVGTVWTWSPHSRLAAASMPTDGVTPVLSER